MYAYIGDRMLVDHPMCNQHEGDALASFNWSFNEEAACLWEFKPKIVLFDRTRHCLGTTIYTMSSRGLVTDIAFSDPHQEETYLTSNYAYGTIYPNGSFAVDISGVDRGGIYRLHYKCKSDHRITHVRDTHMEASVSRVD